MFRNLPAPARKHNFLQNTDPSQTPTCHIVQAILFRAHLPISSPPFTKIILLAKLASSIGMEIWSVGSVAHEGELDSARCN